MEPIPGTMRAVIADGSGGPEVPKVVELENVGQAHARMDGGELSERSFYAFKVCNIAPRSL